jgi:hypothetical protein
MWPCICGPAFVALRSYRLRSDRGTEVEGVNCAEHVERTIDAYLVQT